MATDDWPFLYLRKPMVPNLGVRGMALIGGLAALLLVLFRDRRGPSVPSRLTGLDGRMFLLGAGFMLIETKAVVQMALCFGGTWIVSPSSSLQCSS
jgi:hypothetical protein